MGTEHRCDAGAPAAGQAPRYYRFLDSTGRIHLVDSIDSVPQALRARAECIQYSGSEQSSAVSRVKALVPQGASGWQTFGLGFVTAVIAVLVFKRLPGTFRIFLRLAIAFGVVALLGGLYLGYIRRMTQPSSTDTLATPGALIDDAKQAVDQLNARMKAQQEELKEIERAR